MRVKVDTDETGVDRSTMRAEHYPANQSREEIGISPIEENDTYRRQQAIPPSISYPQPGTPLEPGISSLHIVREVASNVEQRKMKLPPTPPVDAVKFCQFATASPTPFHATANLVTRLISSGFTRLSERNPSAHSLKAGGKYFYTRNQSSLVAFTLPPSTAANAQPSANAPTPTPAVSFAVGHLDSCALKLRPVSKKTKAGYLQVAVELYGGGIWASWFDRDLSIAGRVIVSTSSAKGQAGQGQAQGQGGDEHQYTSKLVKIDRPLMRIPTLAIHLDRTINEAFKFNKETEFAPILGLVSDAMNAPSIATAAKTAQDQGTEQLDVPKPEKGQSGRSTPVLRETEEGKDVTGQSERHHPMLLAVLADELGCEVGDIQDFELSLYDTQPSTVGGLSNEFIFSPRIDNLMTCFASVEGLCNAVEAKDADKETNVRCVTLFDNEEIGSVSHHGAESNLLPSFIHLLTSPSSPDHLEPFRSAGYHQVLANSFLISADMGHAIHPNYESKAEPNHAPRLNGGVVVKTNANQRYTSTAQTTFLLRRVAKKAGVPLQEFEIRNDSSCGSTVGPHLSTHVRTVDIGLSQLSMHSIRETSGSADVRHYIKLFESFFDGFAEIDRSLKID